MSKFTIINTNEMDWTHYPISYDASGKAQNIDVEGFVCEPRFLPITTENGTQIVRECYNPNDEHDKIYIPGRHPDVDDDDYSDHWYV